MGGKIGRWIGPRRAGEMAAEVEELWFLGLLSPLTPGAIAGSGADLRRPIKAS